MKIITAILLVLLTVSLSAQKVERKDLNKILLKGDVSSIEKSGFVFCGTYDGVSIYQRYDSTEVISFSSRAVVFIARDVSHNYKGNTYMSPKGDMFWGSSAKRYSISSIEDSTGVTVDVWAEYVDKKTVFECRDVISSGVAYTEFLVYRK